MNNIDKIIENRKSLHKPFDYKWKNREEAEEDFLRTALTSQEQEFKKRLGAVRLYKLFRQDLAKEIVSEVEKMFVELKEIQIEDATEKENDTYRQGASDYLTTLKDKVKALASLETLKIK